MNPKKSTTIQIISNIKNSISINVDEFVFMEASPCPLIRIVVQLKMARCWLATALYLRTLISYQCAIGDSNLSIRLLVRESDNLVVQSRPKFVNLTHDYYTFYQLDIKHRKGH